MKNFTFWLLCFVFISSIKVFGQSENKELAPGYYVVVGAYADTREDAAQRFVENLNKSGHNAAYGFNNSRNLYFVYLEYYTTLKEALRNMERTRNKGKFMDAWVRVVAGDIKPAVSSASTTPQPETKEALAPTSTGGVSAPVAKDELQTSAKKDSSSTVATDSIVVTDNPEIKQYEHVSLGNTEVFLSLYNARNNRIIDGDVQVVDTDRARQIMKVKGNEYLLLPDPKSKSGQLTLICDVFGYRKIQNELNYPVPLADTVKPHIDLMGTTIVVNFDLVRYHRGDIATLYNVYFYNDAAIMLPESKFELGALLQLMQENPNYRIRLHGHTNGNYHGKIITLGPDKNFFTLTGSKESIGSAKDLSRQRAEIIKEYLKANGIDESRVEVKSWGGKRPLYNKESVNARKNVRVEVEMLSE